MDEARGSSCACAQLDGAESEPHAGGEVDEARGSSCACAQLDGAESEPHAGGEVEEQYWSLDMEMKKVSAGNLRAIGYDASRRVVVVEQSSGTFEYANVSPEVWRRFSTASSLLSFFRDTIEEDYQKKRIK